MKWAAQLANCSPCSILDFSASINPLGPPASAIATLHAQLHTHLQSLRSYPDPTYHHLRHAIGRFHAIDPDWIIPGNGAAELITWICHDLAESSRQHDQSTMLLTPAFGDYERALSAFGGSIHKYPLNLDMLLAATHAAQLIPQAPLSGSSLLLNNPHNPTGIMFSADSVERACRQLSPVVVDEAFMDFLPPERQQSAIHRVEAYPNLVVMRSLTKFYSLPGLRIGYAIAHPDHIRRWQRWRDPWPVNALAEAAAIAVLSDTDFQQKTWQWLETARSEMMTGLVSIPGLLPFPATANFVLVRSSIPVPPLQRWLLQHYRILIRDCISFPELGDRYFRIAIRTSEENTRLLNALTKGLQALS